MVPARRASTASRLTLAGLLATCIGAAAWPLAVPAEAATTVVEVRSDGDASYAPEVVEVQPGGTVRWVWTEDEAHSITFEDRPLARNDRCPGIDTGSDCKGHTHEVTFEEAGEYDYRDELNQDAPGTVVVREVEETPSPTPSRSESDDPGPTPSASSTSPEPEPSTTPPSEDDEDDAAPTPSDSGDPTGGGGGATEDDPEPSDPSPSASRDEDDAPDPEPESRRADGAPLDTATSPSPSPTATADVPTVAASETATPEPVPDPTFEDFPEAREPREDTEVGGEVAVGASDGTDETARTVWGAIGGVTLLGTIGAFGRRVLFADDWDG